MAGTRVDKVLQTAQSVDRTIKALDGHDLASTHFVGSNPSGPVVLINSGTAIPQRFYRHFAAYIAARGASVVITYDYRGIGDSWPDGDRTFQYLMSDWARQDFPAIVDWAKLQHPDNEIYAIGHSFGGQAIGLSDRNRHISRAINIASMTGYWRKFTIPERYKVFLTFFVALPLIGRIYGYVPGKFGLSEDMAMAAVNQWGRWCSTPDYFFSDPDLPEVANFGSFQAPLLSIGLDDDGWGTSELIDHMMDHYTSAELTRRQYSPKDAGGPVGHFNFFKPKFEESLWRPTADWLFELPEQA